jgi:acetyltransferase-like isoleucine patch superfamily enzyme
MPIRDNFHKEEDVEVGEGLDTGYNVVLRKGCKIGKNVQIWSNSVIDSGAQIGDRAKVHCNVYCCQNAIVEEDVFLAPNCTLCNDKYPVRTDPQYWEPPTIKKGARICAGAIIMPGVTIGEKAIIGAGAIVLTDVPAGQIWVGNPARRIR